MSSGTSHLWSAGQIRAYEELLEAGQLFYFSDWTHFKVKPRLAKLVVGPSGMGKSHLIREVAREIGVPCMRLTASSWIVSGASKELTSTLVRVRQFIEENDRGLIFLDEADKMTVGSSDWGRFVVHEAFDLLDRIPGPSAKEWSPEAIHKLKYDYWFVGAGTWQQVWLDTAQPKMGFGNNVHGSTEPTDIGRLVDSSNAVPLELRRRFNFQLVLLAPAEERDYRNAAESFGLAKLAAELKMPLDYPSAVAANLGARWLEESMAQLLLKARRENRTDLLQFRPHVPENSIEPEDLEFGIDDHVL